MAINVSVQYNVGPLPGIILLILHTLRTLGNSFESHEELLSLQAMFPPKPLDIFPRYWVDAQEGLDVFRFFFKTLLHTILVPVVKKKSVMKKYVICNVREIMAERLRAPFPAVI